MHTRKKQYSTALANPTLPKSLRNEKRSSLSFTYICLQLLIWLQRLTKKKCLFTFPFIHCFFVCEAASEERSLYCNRAKV